MGEQLDHLSEADIQARCSQASFERGRRYYTGGAVRQRVRLDDGLETRVSGTHAYRVTVREAPGGLAAFCTPELFGFHLRSTQPTADYQ
jgi:uncharacterized Zn finger protein